MILHSRGITLIELMVSLAIIAIITAIAIPAYDGYMEEARLSAARQNAESVRIFIEDFGLDNGTYVADSSNAGAACTVSGTYDQGDLEDCFDWDVGTADPKYSYQVVANTTNWSIVVQNTASGDWVRCENRMSECCYSDTPEATTSACP